MKKGTYKHSPEKLKKMSLAQKGHLVSEETKKLVSEMHKGKHFSPKTEFKKGITYPERRNRVEIECKICKKIFEVKKSSADRRINCSKECFVKWQSLKIRHKSPVWKGGKSFEPYSVDWTETLKRSIRERDKYICQLCGEDQGDISHCVHHIDYDKKNSDTKNLITLCNSCHSETNWDREYWTNYFNNI